jgi:integrase
MSFDARAAKLLQPGAHLTIDGSPGLRLEATAQRRSWTYRYRSPVDQRMRQLQLGLWPAMSFHAAVAEWEKLRQARDAGRDPALERRQARDTERTAKAEQAALRRDGGYKVEQLASDYVTGHVRRRRKAKGADEVERMFDKMLAPIAGKTAATLTRRQAFDLLELYQGIPVQAAKLRAELGAAWDYALDAGRLPDTTPNWWRQIMRGRLRSTGKRIAGVSIGPGKRVLVDAEVTDLVRWLPNFPRLIDDVLTLYLWTLCRGSEIVSMEAAEISEEADGWWWTVQKAKTKNARHAGATDLRVPLVGRALAVVKRRLVVMPKGYLFPSAGRLGHVEQKTVQTAVHWHQPYSRTRPEQVRPRLTVTHWAPHDLRRTGRTMLAALECPDDVAEALLGHMQTGVKGVYNRHGYDPQRRVWLTRLAVRLEALAGA